MADRLYKAISRVQKEYGLNDGEFDVLTCLCKGMDLKKMAEELYIQEGTAKNRKRNMIRKISPEKKKGIVPSIQVMVAVIKELLEGE